LRILLTGAAGLVGQGVALACQRSPQVAGLTALVRHPGSLRGPAANGSSRTSCTSTRSVMNWPGSTPASTVPVRHRLARPRPSTGA
jgi:hypothetical protein